jgi:hypothetical protein
MPPTSPGAVEPHELVTRFIYSAEHFAATTGRVRAAAISPLAHRVSGRLETSVYRVDSLPEPDVWAICAAHVDNTAAARIMKARATCDAGLVLAQGLTFDPDGQPHPRHANIVGWPSTKNEQKNLQQRIVAEMKLDLRPKG